MNGLPEAIDDMRAYLVDHHWRFLKRFVRCWLTVSREIRRTQIDVFVLDVSRPDTLSMKSMNHSDLSALNSQNLTCENGSDCRDAR